MADPADLPVEELEELLGERAKVLGGELIQERTEDGDWLVSIKQDGETLFGAEAAEQTDALILLSDAVGS